MYLDKIVEAARKRVANMQKCEDAKTRIVCGKQRSGAPTAAAGGAAERSVFNSKLPFESSLSNKDLSFVCEVKKASPSKGLISPDFNYMQIAKDYEAGGAAAISVLTEPDFFLGKNDYLSQIKREAKIPVLRKDFIIDERQIYETKDIGADALLLICAILDFSQLKSFLELASSLELCCLVEAHDEKEIESALKAGAKIIGVNNRNLKTFEVDFSNAMRLRKLVPNDRIFVSESGIKTKEHIEMLRACGVNAVLIGETLMRSGNILKDLKDLKGV
jgi:indole-3-glycerol phosphate synthase